MDKFHDHLSRLADTMATLKAGLLSGGLTTMAGYLSDLTLVGAVGILVSTATVYFSYARHRREVEIHELQRDINRVSIERNMTDTHHVNLVDLHIKSD